MANRLNYFIDRIDTSKKIYWVCFTVLALLSAALIFTCINVGRVEKWDESIYAISSYEMLKNHKFFVNTWNGVVDYSNTKPVLAFWPLMLSFSIFGFNQFALKLPSALCYIAISIIIGLYMKKRYSPSISIFSMLCVLCAMPLNIITQGFVLSQNFRSGDPNALFILFLLLSALFMLETKRDKKMYIFAFLMVSLAILTKGLHGFVPLFAYLIFYLLQKDYKHLKWWYYICSLLALFIPLMLWGLGRELEGHDLTKVIQSAFGDIQVRNATQGYTFYLTIVGAIGTPSWVLLIFFLIVKLCQYSKQYGFKFTMKRIGKSFSFNNYSKHYDVLLILLILFTNLFFYALTKDAFMTYSYFPNLMGSIIFPLVLVRYLDYVPTKRNVILHTSTYIMSVAVIVCFVLNGIPKQSTGMAKIVEQYHQEVVENRNSYNNEIIYTEDACYGNISYEGEEAWCRHHDALYRVEVEYRWNYSTKGIKGYHYDNNPALIIIKKSHMDKISGINHIVTYTDEYNLVRNRK